MIRPLLTSAAIALSGAVQAQECIDLELALLADVSISMDDSEKELQRAGYIAAFRDAEIIHAITDGYCGAIAVAYFEFGTNAKTVVDWQIIASDEDAEGFAASIEAAGPTLDAMGTTGLSRAIEHAAQSVFGNSIEADRIVFDLSSDGPDNVTNDVSDVRDKYTTATENNGWREITINGLPILSGTMQYGMDADTFQDYYATNVIGGPGHFLEPAKGIDDLYRALRRKLIVEIG